MRGHDHHIEDYQGCEKNRLVAKDEFVGPGWHLSPRHIYCTKLEHTTISRSLSSLSVRFSVRVTLKARHRSDSVRTISPTKTFMRSHSCGGKEAAFAAGIVCDIQGTHEVQRNTTEPASSKLPANTFSSGLIWDFRGFSYSLAGH